MISHLFSGDLIFNLNRILTLRIYSLIDLCKIVNSLFRKLFREVV